MHLRIEFSRLDHRNELGWGRQFDGKTGFGREIVDAVVSLQEIGMDPVAEASGAGCGRPQGKNGARGISGLLKQFALAACRRVFTRIDKTSGQLECKRFDRRSILSHQRKPSVRRQRDDGEIIVLADGMIDLCRLIRREFNFPGNDLDPRRYRAGLPGLDLRPLVVHPDSSRYVRWVFNATVDGERCKKVVAKA